MQRTVFPRIKPDGGEPCAVFRHGHPPAGRSDQSRQCPLTLACCVALVILVHPFGELGFSGALPAVGQGSRQPVRTGRGSSEQYSHCRPRCSQPRPVSVAGAAPSSCSTAAGARSVRPPLRFPPTATGTSTADGCGRPDLCQADLQDVGLGRGGEVWVRQDMWLPTASW